MMQPTEASTRKSTIPTPATFLCLVLGLSTNRIRVLCYQPKTKPAPEMKCHFRPETKTKISWCFKPKMKLCSSINSTQSSSCQCRFTSAFPAYYCRVKVALCIHCTEACLQQSLICVTLFNVTKQTIT